MTYTNYFAQTPNKSSFCSKNILLIKSLYKRVPYRSSNAAFKRGQRICTCIYPMPSVAGSLSRAALIKRLRGIWERYRLRAEAAQNRRNDGHGRVYAWGQVTKETQTAQGHRRSTKEIRASVRIAASRWRQPRAQDYRLQQRRCRRSYSGTGHPGGIRKNG